jgi:membrane fusion protein (multidrug efflux system)
MAIVAQRRLARFQAAVVVAAVAASTTAAVTPSAAQEPVPAVQVVRVEPRDVTPTVEFVGRVEAVRRADLRARVTAILEEQNFVDGDRVRAGDVLFVLEQAPFEAAVLEAEADLQAARASAENAELQLARAEQLVANNNIPQATVDERRADARIANAAVAQAEAALTQARITLGYTEIATPIDGRVGRAMVKVGNLVGPETGVLATVVQQDPVYVTFGVAERELLAFRRRAQEREQEWRESTIVLRLRFGDGSLYGETGTLDFVDVQVDRQTDTVTVRGTFPNPDELLVDGQFVEVLAARAEPETALLVPMSVVQVDQQGSFVLVVDEQDEVAIERVVTGAQIGRDVVVEGGLEEGDRVIVEGLMKVRPGMGVRPAAAGGEG